MKKVILLILLIVILIGTGVVSADPVNNPNKLIVNMTCEDGFSGDVLVPALSITQPMDNTAMGFFNGGIDGLGRPRSITITPPGGPSINILYVPGQGFETVACSFWDGPVLVELDIQRISRGN